MEGVWWDSLASLAFGKELSRPPQASAEDRFFLSMKGGGKSAKSQLCLSPCELSAAVVR